MKKTLLVIMLGISCFISFSFAANRIDKYQAIKEGWEYYNKLQEIYKDENYQNRRNNSINECENTYKQWTNKCGQLWFWITPECPIFDGLPRFFKCETPSRRMTEEEYTIYNYIENPETVSIWAVKDNECYQSMNWYYDEKEDKCSCEDWFLIENNICIKDKIVKEANRTTEEETESQKDAQKELTEKFNNALNYGKEKDYNKAAELLNEIIAKEWSVEWDNYKVAKQALKIFKEAIEKNVEENVKNDIPEINRAISRMYDNWLTIFNDPESFMTSNWLRRDEASKFFVKYAKEIIGMVPDYSKQWCSFKDLDKARPDLKDIIVEACQLGLFQWSNWKFMPDQLLTNAQAITVFMRLHEWYKDESGSHFANNYYESAHAQWLLSDTLLDDKTNFDMNTTRGDVAKMLFRWQNK